MYTLDVYFTFYNPACYKSDFPGKYLEMQFVDKAVELPESHILNMRSYRTIVCQRWFMAIAALLGWVGLILYIVALATTSWAIVEFENIDFNKIKIHLGVFGEYRTVKNWKSETVEWIPHFPAPPDKILRLNDADLKNYYYAQAAIGMIACVLLIVTNCIALYTFYHHRYMFKRLCACFYAVTGGVIYATEEIIENSVSEWNREVVHNGSTDSWDYEMVMQKGFSTRLVQITIAICVFAFLSFAFGSHKQKGDNAACAEFEIEDRPVHIGR